MELSSTHRAIGIHVRVFDLQPSLESHFNEYYSFNATLRQGGTNVTVGCRVVRFSFSPTASRSDMYQTVIICSHIPPGSKQKHCVHSWTGSSRKCILMCAMKE